MSKIITPIKAIRAKCLDCVCYQKKEVRDCPVVKCSLWPYRLGKRPKTAKAQRKAIEFKKSA